MPVLINTRPQSAKPLAFDDIVVLDLPLLELHAFDDNELGKHEIQAMTEFIAGGFDMVLAVSKQAVQGATQYLSKHGISHASKLKHLPTFVAVGDATKAALMQFGFSAITPDVMSNEGMLAMPQIQALSKHHRLLIWRGVGGRRLLHNTLNARGVEVCAIEWYQRQIISELSKQFAVLADKLPSTPVFVLISSQLSLQAWASLPHRHTYHYLALGERLYKLTQARYPNAAISQLDTLNADHIHQAITKPSLV